MANAAAKQQVVNNTQRLRTAASFIALGGVLFLFFRLILKYQSSSGRLWTYFAAAIGTESVVYFWLYSLARAKYNPGGSLADPGYDITSKGLTEYAFDYIVVVSIVNMLAAFINLAFWLLLVIPVFALYSAYVNIVQPAMSASKQMKMMKDMEVETETRAQRRARERSEKRGKKPGKSS